MKKRILILGPNGVGKTKAAYELARRHGGEIINADRTYLYKGFPITTGLQDTLKERGVPRHLYELLETSEPSYSAEVFVEMVIAKMDEILERSDLAIVEGGSTLYVPALLERNARERIFDRVIGLRFRPGTDVASAYRQRVECAISDGLLHELSENLGEYKASFLIKECHFAVPMSEFLEGELDLSEAKRDIVRRWVAYKDHQLAQFASRNIDWVEREDFLQNVGKLMLDVTFG